MESFKYGSYNQKEYGMDEMLTPTDIQKHLKRDCEKKSVNKILL